ncbi:protein, SNF2 family, partial [Cooperia oncophora]
MTDINPLAIEWEEQGLSLRDYQKEGVSAMDSWYHAGHGGINGDEMGLGKTCQAIVQMLRFKRDGKGPFLVVCPLSVCDHWISEVTRFSCGTLNPVGYLGHESARVDLLKELKTLKRNTVFITPYHKGLQVKSKLRFEVVIVDEAHAIKNSESQLAESLKPYRSDAWFLLMTGTPIQNHLGELYSLLTFVDPAIVQMLRLKRDGKGPFLVVCPLSVCDHWISEVTRFSCGTLNPVGYLGHESARVDLLKELKTLKRNTVFITPYH